MVAPYLPMQLTRSLVRVPNSGWERPQEVDVMDLSRVSSAAALVQGVSDLPPSLFTSRNLTLARSSSSPTSRAPGKKLSTPVTSPSVPLRGVGVVPRPAATVRLPSASTSETIARPAVLQKETLLPRQGASENVTSRTTPTPQSTAGGRKRPLPVVPQDAARTEGTSATTGEVRAAKIARTSISPQRQPRNVQAYRRVTKEQLIREMERLRSENEALRSVNEACRNSLISILNRHRLASGVGALGVQVH